MLFNFRCRGTNLLFHWDLWKRKKKLIAMSYPIRIWSDSNRLVLAIKFKGTLINRPREKWNSLIGRMAGSSARQRSLLDALLDLLLVRGANNCGTTVRWTAWAAAASLQSRTADRSLWRQPFKCSYEWLLMALLPFTSSISRLLLILILLIPSA